jgi:hypothetical protein
MHVLKGLLKAFDLSWGKMGLNWLLFLVGQPYLIGIWFSEDQRANIIKRHV